MSYPIAYDELLSRDEMLKGLTLQFDDIHNYIKKLRGNNPRNNELRPHKVAKHINKVLAEYIQNKKPDYLDTTINQSSNQCEGNHILSNILGDNIVGCELCPSTFQIYEIKEECVT